MIEIQASDFDGFLYLLGRMVDEGVKPFPVGGNRFTIEDDEWEAAKHGLVDVGGALVEIVGHPDPEMIDAFTVQLLEELAAPESDGGDLIGEGGHDDDDSGDGEPVERPPASGPGSGRDAWAAYAAAQGFDVDDDMGRDEIIEMTERGAE